MLTDTGIAASRKRIAPFRLFRPRTVEEACDLLRQWPRACVHAGGIDLVNRLKNGNGASEIVALTDIGAMQGIAVTGDMVEIGAATTHRRIETDPLLSNVLPVLPRYVAGLGNIRIRTQGTIGGNIMAAEPGYEMPALLAALGAELRFVNWSDGARVTTPARAFTREQAAPFSSHLLTAIAIPLRATTVVWNRELRPGLALVASLHWDDDRIASGLCAITGDRRGPLWRELALDQPMSRVEASQRAELLTRRWAAQIPPIHTAFGPDQAYCSAVIPVLLRRAFEQMLRDAP